MRATVALFCLAAAATAAPIPKAVKKSPDPDRFVGSWEVVRSELNGQPRWGDSATRVFDADLKMKSIQKGNRAVHVSNWVIKIDPEKTPSCTARVH